MSNSDRYEKENKRNGKSVFFINRYMKYRVKEEANERIIQADIFDYKNSLKKFAHSNCSLERHKERRHLGEESSFPVNVLDDEGVKRRRERFGLGTMVIDRPSLSVLFFREIVQPLYFFILFSIILWMSQSYLLYCGAIFITSAVGIGINLYQTYQSNNKIHSMAYYEIEVNALRKRS